MKFPTTGDGYVVCMSSAMSSMERFGDISGQQLPMDDVRRPRGGTPLQKAYWLPCFIFTLLYRRVFNGQFYHETEVTAEIK